MRNRNIYQWVLLMDMLLNKQVLHRIQPLSRHIEHQNDTEIEEPIQKIDLDYFDVSGR